MEFEELRSGISTILENDSIRARTPMERIVVYSIDREQRVNVVDQEQGG
jgi:hypothetical protein